MYRWLIVMLVCGLAVEARAMPPPMSVEQLEASAEVIVDVEVTAAVCGQRTEHDGYDVIDVRSTVRVLARHKGTAPDTFTYVGGDIDIYDRRKVPIGGPLAPSPLPAGWRGRLYLVGAPAHYALVYYNGAAEDPASKPVPLQCKHRGCGGCSTGESSGWIVLGLAGLVLQRRRRSELLR